MKTQHVAQASKPTDLPSTNEQTNKLCSTDVAMIACNFHYVYDLFQRQLYYRVIKVNDAALLQRIYRRNAGLQLSTRTRFMYLHAIGHFGGK